VQFDPRDKKVNMKKWGNHYHWDFSDEVMQIREPNKQPYSVIVALDSFKFKFEEQSCLGDKIHRKILVESGHAVVFTNALNHPGGANLMPLVDGDHPYVYTLFAYAVSNPVDYPPGEGGTIKPVFEMIGTAETVDDKNARDGSPPLMSIGGRIRRPTERYNPSSADKKNEKSEMHIEKKRPKRNRVIKRETLFYVGINIE
jgi:hypothetical protein